MEKIKKVLAYWRNSLADAYRMEIRKGKLQNARYVDIEIAEGHLPQKDVNMLFKEKVNLLKRLLKKKDEEIEIQKVEVLVSPLRVVEKVEHAKEKYGHKKREVYPMWIPAVLDKAGRLKPSSELAPWIIRSVLEPVQQLKWLSCTIGTVDALDEYLTLHDVPIEKWGDYIKYCTDMFHHVTGKSMKDFRVDGFLSDLNLTVLLNSEYGEAGEGIIKLYDYLRNEENIPPLLGNFADLEITPIKEISGENDYVFLSEKHVGQMGYEFYLSESQRRALYNYFSLVEGDILAVNGPPGTGKTTLLQSVVANSVVESAIKGEKPAIIAASSANNQAIENIIESFGKTGTKPGKLSGRWLPEIISYALFLPAYKAEIRKGIHYTKWNREGLPESIEKKGYHEEAAGFFLEHCSRYAEKDIADVNEAVDLLHERLKDTAAAIKECSILWRQFYDAGKDLSAYDKFDGTAGYKKTIASEIKKHEEILEGFTVLRREWLQEVRSESLLARLLIFFWKQIRQRKTGSALLDDPCFLSYTDRLPGFLFAAANRIIYCRSDRGTETTDK